MLLIALSGGIANASFQTAIYHGDVVRVMILFYLSPVWAVLLGAAVFGERPAATDYLAMAIILAGIALSQRSPSGDVRAPDQVEKLTNPPS